MRDIEIFNKRIKSYQKDIEGRDIAIKNLNKDRKNLNKDRMDKAKQILLFENETLWMMIKRWWKR